ncbi:hypothetical protein H5410_056349, partial [Solanum commersonii]
MEQSVCHRVVSRSSTILLNQEGDEIDQKVDCRVYRQSRLIALSDPLEHKCFWLAQERGRQTKTTKLIASGIGLTWRVNGLRRRLCLMRQLGVRENRVDS